MSLVECGKRNLCNELLSFIDSLQEEPVSEDLEDFALQYAGHHAPYDDCMQEMEDAVKAGAKWQRQQMIKTAIETEVVDDSFGQQVGEVPAVRYDVQPEDNLEIGDKVKLIIIKED